MLNRYFYNLSITILGIVTSIFILTTVGGLFHIPVNPFYVLIPLIVGCYYIKTQSTDKMDFLKQILILLILTMLFYFISISVWDFSWDGRSSHIATAILYKNGWLPVYQNYADFAELCNVYERSAFWGNCYLHFTEIVGANIYKITNLIESAKTINFIMLFCLFMYSFVIFKGLFQNKKFIPILMSALLVINPVCICEWFTNDIDLHIYISFTILLLTLIKIERQREADKKDLFVFVCSSLMLAMTKFTGSMYLFLICSIYFAYLFLQKRNVRKFIKSVLVVGGLIAVTGVNPFYTNFRDFGHPFHPLFGTNKINIIDESIPYGFQNMSNIERFLRSTFSESVQSMNNAVDQAEQMRKPVILKIPFTINIKSFLNTFCFADVRVGGFGYFWSGILLLSLLFLPFIRFRNKNEKNIFWLSESIIIITTLANPHAWWARYVPQFWLFPILILLFGFAQENFKNNITKHFKSLLLCLITISIIANCFIIFKQNFMFNIFSTIQMHKSYDYIDSVKKPQEKLYFTKIPAWENMVIADETILPHLQEYYGKENVIVIPYDESYYNSPQFIPLQVICVISRLTYFVKIGE